MKSIPMPVTVAAIVAITFVSGIVQGSLSGRWGPTPDLVKAGEALGEFPKILGDWELDDEDQISDTVTKELRCTGSVFRTYVNRETEQSVRIAIVVGPPGPISVHTPEICYSSQAYTQRSERTRVHVDSLDGSNDGDFWSLEFEPKELNSARLRVYYAWTDGNKWQATENPRITFSRGKLLYKIQLAAGIPAADVGTDTADPCRSFLQTLLSEPNTLRSKARES